MIATSTYDSTHSTGGNYTYTTSDVTGCSDPTCDHAGTCCCSSGYAHHHEVENAEEIVKEALAAAKLQKFKGSVRNCTIREAGGVVTRHFTFCRTGATAKKIKLVSGLNC